MALADLDRLEPSARPQPGRGPSERVGPHRVADLDAGQKQDVRVGDRVVPVHPQLGDDLRRGRPGRRGGLRRGRRRGEQHREHRARKPAEKTVPCGGPGALRGHRPSPVPTSRPPVSASR